MHQNFPLSDALFKLKHTQCHSELYTSSFYRLKMVIPVSNKLSLKANIYWFQISNRIIGLVSSLIDWKFFDGRNEWSIDEATTNIQMTHNFNFWNVFFFLSKKKSDKSFTLNDVVIRTVASRLSLKPLDVINSQSLSDLFEIKANYLPRRSMFV